MFICSDCGKKANAYEVDQKLTDVSGVSYNHMRLCENCFTTNIQCILCDGNVIENTNSETSHKICHNCRCIFIYHNGTDPAPIET